MPKKRPPKTDGFHRFPKNSSWPLRTAQQLQTANATAVALRTQAAAFAEEALGAQRHVEAMAMAPQVRGERMGGGVGY